MTLAWKHTPYTESSVLVVGLVRNCEKTVAADVHVFASALKDVKAVKWLLVESDSDDQTVSKLASIAEKEADFKYLSLGKLSDQLPKRTERIAHCRNRYIEEIKNNSEYENIDYVLVADFDGVNNLIDKNAIESCWSNLDWDVCAANQSGPYYDIWALRHELWSPNDCWEVARFYGKHNIEKHENTASAVLSRMITLSPDSGWLQVDSAFGGCVIYKKPALIIGEYIGLTDNNDEICEHVSLHQKITEHGGKIFINPQMINAEYTEHSYIKKKQGMPRKKKKAGARLYNVLIKKPLQQLKIIAKD